MGCKTVMVTVLACLGLQSACVAQTAARALQGASAAEQQTSRYLESIRHQPLLLRAFLEQMPKGGDLHNHLAGAIYAESFIGYAAQDGLCVDHTTFSLLQPPCSDAHPPAASALGDPVLYGQMIDAFSMRNWRPERESGHDHFFATFYKFLPAIQAHQGDMLAEVASRAASEHVLYLELMNNYADTEAIEFGKKVGWDSDLPRLREKMMTAGLGQIVAEARHRLDQAEASMRGTLRCNTPQADPGCRVTIRQLVHVLRGFPPEQVFAQILEGFELARTDPRVVGLNLVMPEDWYIPMRDFDLHMRMLDYLHGVYPQVHISLHAGELAPGLVAPEGLRFHIRESIEHGHAERIGHGVDVMYERDPTGLLQEMARRNLLVEICLTSNDVILGVRGAEHPLPLYMKYGVPVALATDDAGVSRSDMTHEYQRAVETYELKYEDLKRMARASLEHSFLAGTSLWADAARAQKVAACALENPTGTKLSPKCQNFLDSSDKAGVQWEQERALAAFESRY